MKTAITLALAMLVVSAGGIAQAASHSAPTANGAAALGSDTALLSAAVSEDPVDPGNEPGTCAAASLAAAVSNAGRTASSALDEAATADGTTTVLVPLQDTIITMAHRGNNDGAWGYTWIKCGNGCNRALYRADPTPLAARTDDIISATVRLYIAKSAFTERGTIFASRPYDAASGVVWLEGNDRFDNFNYCEKSAWYRAPKKVGGAGATFSCPQDPWAWNAPTIIDCLTKTWDGGFPGFSRTVTATATHYYKERVLCSTSLACLGKGGSPDSCWKTSTFDVTADVVGFLRGGPLDASWLVSRLVESGEGGVWWFSREFKCISGIDGFAPMLVVTLRGEAPVIPPLPAHCDSY
ncbi:MAG: hypothetical protein FJ038_06210 [Chloroflexi bacterium]|nr:hypothetical protein [Chloroflexota bacterium]